MKPAAKTTGLRYWMESVLDECEHVAADFSADPVHDLRVALRRCRSLADGLIAIDPDPDWKAMKKAGKRLFQKLGELRDIQIMMEWLEKLGPVTASAGPGDGSTSLTADSNASQESEQSSVSPSAPLIGEVQNESQDPNQPDPAMRELLEILKNREDVQKHEAQAALEEFDRKQWCQWSKSLPLRAAHIRPGSSVFKHLALERWMAARELHARAMRNRSQIALHMLRIGIKRFRYIVENFLPVEHKLWSSDLKHMQDLLGEVHDLDVLWATALGCHVFPDEASRKAWHARIVEERTRRVEEYRERTVGPESLWNVWRAGLPQGRQIPEIATRRMKLWAKVLDPDFAHSERVARLALELYDGLGAAGLLGFPPEQRINTKPGSTNGAGSGPRASLQVAALLHDVGKAKGNKGHHKTSLELIKAHGTPLGWNAATMQRAALVARFHAGALPVSSHKALRDLLPEEQKIVVQLSAILRLANAFDTAHDGHIRRVRIENARAGNTANRRQRSNGFLRKPVTLPRNEALVIAAEGYTPGSPTAQTIAAERHLLETILRRPVVVKAMKHAA
jgi:CHAD domain-containing protein